jgi:capsular polysaccharide transport system permease protein
MKMSFQRSLIIQARVIGALLRREFITRYGRHNIGFLWLFAEPMLFTAGVTLIWRYLHQSGTHGSPITIVSFTITGYSTVMLWRNGVSRCLKAIEPNLGLLYHRNVRVIDLMTARLVLETAGATTSLIAIMSLCILMGWIDPPVDIITMAFAWLLLTWYSFGVGFIAGAISEFSDAFERVWHIIMYLYLPVSGAFFLIQWLPVQMRRYALLVPTVNVTEMLRGGYYGHAVRTYYDPVYLMQFNMILLLIGLALIKMASHRVEPG